MAKQTEKILVINEDRDITDLIAQQVLAPQGYPVAVAHDGPSALQTALKMQPDIIVTSIELPGLSGRDLITALRSQGFQSVVIAMGPKGSETHMVQAFRLGAKDYLTTPLREAEVVSALDRAIQEIRLRSEKEQLSQKLSQANTQLEKRVKELTTLYGIGKAVTASTDLNQLMTRLMDGALFVTEGDVGWFLLADEGQGNKLILRAGKNLPPAQLSNIRLNAPWDDGLSGLIMLSGEGITIHGDPLAKMKAGNVVKAAVAVPIKSKDQVMGVLVAGNKSGKPFNERDQAMLSAVGDYASIALSNAKLFQSVEAKARSLQKAYDDVAEGGRVKDDMVLRVGRELRQPVMQARSAVEPVLRGQAGPLTPQQTEALRMAMEKLDGMQRLVDDMTLLSDTVTRPANPRPVSLADLAKQSITRLGSHAKELGVALFAELPADPIMVAGDAAQLSRVFDNLIENGIRFSPQGGQVTVTIKAGPNNTGMVAIADKGIGIPGDKLPRVWEKFYQVDATTTRKYGGTGIGLTVVKQVIDGHGGKVWAESEPGKGSVFYFSLVRV